MNSQDKSRELLDLLKEQATRDASLKELNKKVGALCQDLNEQMTEEEVDSIEVEGIKFTPYIEIDYKLKDADGCTWDNYPAWFEWLSKVGEDGLIRSKLTVPPQTRKKFLKDWSEENELPDFAQETFYSTVRYNKAAIKRLANE